MRFAFFGDVVGKSGRDGLADHLPDLRRQLGLEFVIINAENAAAGFGITENTARELFEAGAITNVEFQALKQKLLKQARVQPAITEAACVHTCLHASRFT